MVLTISFSQYKTLQSPRPIKQIQRIMNSPVRRSTMTYKGFSVVKGFAVRFFFSSSYGKIEQHKV